MDFIKWFYSLWNKKQLPQNWDIEKERREISELDARIGDIFGVADLVGQASVDWRPSLSKLEIQAFGDCVTFSRLNCAEIKAKYSGVLDDDGNEINFSDLWLAVKSNTTQNGNSLKAVAEYGRKYGVVLEKYCPYTYNWSDRNNRVNAVSNSTKKYLLGNWAWVNCNNNALKSALSFGPVQIAIGVSSNYNSSGIIKDPKNYQCYHAITLVYMDEIGNKYIFDHYDLSQKVLDKDYNVFYAMTFADLPSDWRGKGSDDILFYKRMVNKLIITPESHGEVYRILEDKIVKVIFAISDKGLWDLITQALREKKAFLGVSNVDFARLSKVAFETGKGIIEADGKVDVSSILNI
ncbi:MAG: C1 family peptidase [Actinomycetota bacterium]